MYPAKVRIGPYDLVIEVAPDFAIRIDVEGRWCSFRCGCAFYRRTVDGEVVRRTSGGYDSPDEKTAQKVHSRIVGLLGHLSQGLSNASIEIELYGELATYDLLMQRLMGALRWTPEEYEAEAGRFKDAYPEAVTILPPDRYRDLVVLPALGCPNRGCYFCAFYRGARFHVLSPEEFRDHLSRVASLFGRALGYRDGVFLGCASALSLSQRRLIGVLETVAKILGRRSRGVAAFHDPDHAPRRSVGDFEDLVAAGLGHVTVGLETGLSPLRGKLGKSDDVKAVVKVVRAQKGAGLRCGVTVLVGVGGSLGAEDHRRATVEAIEAMELAGTDLVYLSPLSGSLPPPELQREVGLFRKELLEVTSAKVTPYRMERFRYFT